MSLGRRETIMQCLQAVLGGPLNKQIYDTYAPDTIDFKQTPGAVYKITSTSPLKDLSGLAGPVKHGVQVDLYSLDPAIADAVNPLIEAAQGPRTDVRTLWVEDGDDDALPPIVQELQPMRVASYSLIMWV